ncbi:O-antigen ligase family protein [Streptomyces sp. NPDC004610]|uniref:O-antigen ligase family protein n=1 Tax=unclassified Streptomyces TaxID=2593676 RepID=UPI0033B209F2
MAVLGGCAIWSLITAAVQGGRPEGALLAVLAVAAGHAAGRIAGALLPVAAPGAAALAGIALPVTLPRLAPGPQPGPPLGHLGATAALLTLAAGAACCAAWEASAPATRLLMRLLALAAAVTAAAVGSVTGAVACVVILLASLAAGRMRRRGPGVAGLALAAAGVTATTWAVAAKVLPDGPTRSLEGPLTAHRVELWREALRLLEREPLLGVGPGRFGELGPAPGTPLASDGKAHSALLQQAAEQGVIGVALLGAAFGWVLIALWQTARPTPVALTAGAALTAVAGIAAVGNALSFTAVTVGAGLLAGLATARPLSEAAGAADGSGRRGNRGAPGGPYG